MNKDTIKSVNIAGSFGCWTDGFIWPNKSRIIAISSQTILGVIQRRIVEPFWEIRNLLRFIDYLN